MTNTVSTERQLEAATRLCTECQSFLAHVLRLLPDRPGKLDDCWSLKLSHELHFESDETGALAVTPKNECGFCNLIATGWRQTSWTSSDRRDFLGTLPGSELEVQIGPGGGGIDVEVEGKSEKEWQMVENIWDLRVGFGDDKPDEKPTSQTSWSSAMTLDQLYMEGDESFISEEFTKCQTEDPLTTNSEPTDQRISQTENSLTTNSNSTYQQINNWRSQCARSHSRCHKFTSREAGDENWLPSRLIDFRDLDDWFNGTVTLAEARTLSVDVEYATLSYCWGPKLFKTLTKGNLGAFKAGFSIKDLPKTFQEAIVAARTLKLSYIWIDALCIIQDDPDDWSRESVSMAKIYTYAALNFSASVSEHADGGLFRAHRKGVIDGFIVSRQTTGRGREDGSASKLGRGQLRFHCHLKEPDASDVYRSMLSRRAWVLQEKTLSPRVIYFTNFQVFWECKSLRACESHPLGYPANDFDAATSEPYVLNLADCFLGERGLGYYTGGPTEITQENIIDLWKRLVKVYSKLQLSYESDKLVALSGVASRLASSCQLGDYLAGIWRDSLLSSLLWHTKDDYDCSRPAVYRAPSWSWSSVDGEIDFLFLGSRLRVLRPALEILDASVTYSGATFGAVTSASLLLKTPMCRVRFDEQVQGVRYKGGVLHMNPTRGYQRGQSLLELLIDPQVKSEDAFHPGHTSEAFLLPVYTMAATPTSNPLQIKEHEGAYLLVSPTGAAKGQYRRIGLFHIIHYRFMMWPRSKNPVMFIIESLGLLSNVSREATRSIAYLRNKLPYSEISRALNASYNTMDAPHYKDHDGQGHYVIELV